MEFKKKSLYSPMFPNQWTPIKLYELAEWINGKAFKKDDYNITGLPVIKIAELNTGLSSNTKYSINNDEKFYIKKGDILFAWSGNPDTSIDTHKFKEKEGYLNQHIFKVLPNDNKIESDFLYYILKYLKPFFKEIARNKQTTGLGHVTISDLKKIQVRIPSENIQKEIADIFIILDSKIEINNKIISNLESQAQAIFKSWFVDFEPFQDGNFVERELGMIPEGWEVKPIGELLDFDIGGGWGKEKPQEKYLIPAYVIRGTDIPDSKFGYFNKDNYRYHTESNLKNRRLQVGDIIFESSGGSTNQDLGRMLMVTDELLNEYNNDVICASFCKLIRINDSSVRWFVYNLLEYSYRNKILTKYEVKSTGISNFSFTIFKDDFKIAVPDRKTIERYFNVTGNNINLSAKLGIQNTKLAELRDALLPKLMAGEIDVSDIKIEGEEVKNE